ALLLLFLCIKRKAKGIEESFHKVEPRLAAVFTLVCALYLIALSLCGFIVATIIIVLIIGALLCRWRFTLREGSSTIALSLLLSFGCHFLFTTLFLMDLPPWPF
ncbi:MAG: tripartite tricarboxylate transporter TctB family protein, partial [Lentisphaeraceae bacterium]|nr:tripartite tricarboxylate transporter TctB family protein [Lentisphaeraceae bacterium]